MYNPQEARAPSQTLKHHAFQHQQVDNSLSLLRLWQKDMKFELIHAAPKPGIPKVRTACAKLAEFKTWGRNGPWPSRKYLIILAGPFSEPPNYIPFKIPKNRDQKGLTRGPLVTATGSEPQGSKVPRRTVDDRNPA